MGKNHNKYRSLLEDSEWSQFLDRCVHKTTTLDYNNFSLLKFCKNIDGLKGGILMSLFVQKCALHVSFDYPHGPVNLVTLKFFILQGPSIESFGENRSPNDQSDDKKCRPRQAGG